MRIEHIAMYVNDLEKARDFFIKYFQAVSNEGYHNKTTDFRSYFLTFDDGARLEIMNKPGMADEEKALARTGYIHIAFSLGSKEAVDQLTAQMKADGMALEAIMRELNLSRASIHSYLPYSKGAYKTKTVSCNADRVRIYRERKDAVVKLQEVLKKIKGWNQTKEWDQNEVQSRTALEEIEMQLWNTLLLFQAYPFQTSKGLKFTYSIKGNELFVTRKEKSITRSTILMAFQKALSLEGFVSGPKKLGTFGASYLYPIFMRIGVIRQKE